MAPVTTGESHPLRLPKVVIIPEIDPEHFAEMSLRVVQRAADAAKLNPAASASCNRARFSAFMTSGKQQQGRSRLCPARPQLAALAAFQFCWQADRRASPTAYGQALVISH